MRSERWLSVCVGVVVLAASVGWVVGVGSAAAESPAAGWQIRSVGDPTSFSTDPAVACPHKEQGNEYCQGFFVTATNVGTAESGAIVLRDTLPHGVSVLAVPLQTAVNPNLPTDNQFSKGSCSTSGSTVTCTYGGPLPPGSVFQILVEVSVESSAGSEILNHAEVEEPGGVGHFLAQTEAPSTIATPVNAGPAGFGVQDFSVGVFGTDGEPVAQAGAHPGAVLTAISPNSVIDGFGETTPYEQAQEPKIENVDLPMGFVGDALTAPRCTTAALVNESCPRDTRVGVVGLFKARPGTATAVADLNLYNVTPEPGYPAQFGFVFLKTVVSLRPRVLPTESGYVLSVPVPAAPRAESVKLHEVSVMFFGDPSLVDGLGTGEAFATNPDACAAGPLKATLEMNAWVEPENWQYAGTAMFQSSPSGGVSGCEALQFDPLLQLTPETTQADSPSGYEGTITVPQTPNFEGDLATPNLKNAVITLPAGVSVDPSAANGLVACQASGPEGIQLGDHDKLANENTAEEGEEIAPDELVHPAPGHCPAASQIGEAEIITPLLSTPLKGHLYVAEPECGNEGQASCTARSAEDGELYAFYLEVAGSGLIIKLKASGDVNAQTGQITAHLTNAPDLPFSVGKLKLNGGPRAPLANPVSCILASTTSDLTPWSTPFTPDATPSSAFAVTGCGAGFAPGFSAGMASTLSAGAFSAFTLTLSRHDGEQDLSGLTVNMPEGLVGKIAGIAECGEAEVKAAEENKGGCPAASRVGTATAAAGAGSDPYWQSGPVYLTGPYNGGSFGLAVVVPANAGPFHLGNIVTRASIRINPVTAAVTVVSNPLPQMIDGAPLRLQSVNVTVGSETPFTFNSTDCAPASVGASVTGIDGATANGSSAYQPSGCVGMPFRPVFVAWTQGRASKAGGASLDVRITARQGPGVRVGEEEPNIRKVDTQLPVELPSRLSTLQQACTEQQFAANPAGCPGGSFVGTAVVQTPLLPVALEGPAILVSHAGRAFPDLDLILQGDGVTIDLTGNTDIKKGVTYSNFEAAPDAPFSKFELKLPEGKDSILAANIPGGGYSFCGLKKVVTTTKTVTKKVKGKKRKVKEKVKAMVPATLEMPTKIVAQDGAVLSEAIKVGVSGCPTAKGAKTARRADTARKATTSRRSK